MNEPELRRAVLDEPDDDAPRLAYADWLEADGRADRAEWVRASCEFARVSSADPRWRPLFDRVYEAFRRCRPPWWEELTNVTQTNDRGLFRFTVGTTRTSRSPQPVKRLGKAAWLGRALDEFWLYRIELHWDDGSLGELVERWGEPASRVPLFVSPAPQIGDEGLRRLLGLPRLQGLDLPGYVLRLPAAAGLSGCAGLEELTLELRNVGDDDAERALAPLAGMPALRRLTLKAHDLPDRSRRPNDADVVRLAGLSGLTRLTLAHAHAVGDGAVDELKRRRPGLTVVRA